MAEFFILRKYRRQGAGTRAARELFDRFPGRWEVAEIPENAPAIAFWRKVIAGYSRGNYEEVWLDNERWKGPVQTFTSP
jgi:predicted acetyltransferase